MHKIGLLGGTFDPVHRGHLQLARAAMQEAQLEKVIMIPAAGPPHKDNAGITPFHHRLEMLRLAVEDEVDIELSSIEGDLPRPSFTVDTVRLFQKGAEKGTVFYFIIGLDAFVEILSWKSCKELLSMVALLVARRKGFGDEKDLEDIRLTLGYKESGNIWISNDGKLHEIMFLDADISELSSSSVRKLLAGQCVDVSGLPDDVRKYIRKNNLYTKRNKVG